MVFSDGHLTGLRSLPFLVVRHLGTDPYPTSFNIRYGSVPNIGTDPYSIYYLGTDRYGSVPNTLSWVRIHTERKPPLGTDPNLICDIGYGSVPNVPRWVRIRTKMLIWAMLGTDPYPTCDIGYGSVPDDDMELVNR